MGGEGSGSWVRWDKKLLAGSQYRIDIRWLNQQGYLHSGASGSLFWTRIGQKIGAMNFYMQKDKMFISYQYNPCNGEGTKVGQIISFDKTPCSYGGYRKWFVCPECGKRAAVLYSIEKYFLCRQCCDLTYDSCNISPLQRIFDKANKLRKRLGGRQGWDYPIADRRKGMHRKTYNRIIAEIKRLEYRGKMGIIQKWNISIS